MKFHLIGDDNAPSFFQVNSTTGLITVKNNLTTENVDFYMVSLFNLDFIFIPKTMSNLMKYWLIHNMLAIPMTQVYPQVFTYP